MGEVDFFSSEVAGMGLGRGFVGFMVPDTILFRN